MILTLAPGYVSNSKNDYAFIHSRVKSYQLEGIESHVFVINNNSRNYIHEDVKVNIGSIDEFVEFVNTHNVEAIYVHFIDMTMIKAIKKLKKCSRLVIFIHGNEALKWYERIFPDMFPNFKSVLGFSHYVLSNIFSIPVIGKFVRTTDKEITLIGVSNWMLDIAKKNWKCNNIKSVVIPNIIDERLFEYYPKDIKQRFKLLSIRSFNSGKYANDITVNIIEKLSEYDEFHKMEFLLIGDGFLFNKLTQKIKNFKNVTLRREFLNHKEIFSLHREYGIFICPTRQDAQGVSMCEAMASGLIPITSNNTAIPEFIPQNMGLACNDEDEMVQKILEIVRNEALFTNLSENVSNFIFKKCSSQKTTQLEINLLHS